jgi:endonuclease/exonuclease/phosphatase (EEP) superfamily protein YafD
MLGRLLQWNQRAARSVTNARRTSLLSILSDIIAQYQPWLVTLQEMVPGADASLHAAGYTVHAHANGAMCTAWNADWIQSPAPGFEHPRYMLDIVSSAHAGRSLAVWNVHLPSRLRSRDEATARALNDLFAEEVVPRRREPFYSTCMELFAGDFNLQPYHPVFWQLRANRCRAWAERKSRDTSHRWLFNPSWELLNAQTPTGGTYYFRNADDSPWYVYDQALMSPEFGCVNAVRAITQIGATSLAKGLDHRPDENMASDHFPLLVPCQI